MYFVSIDIGIIHMAIVCAEVNEDYTVDKIEYCSLDDITVPCKTKNCRFNHGKNLTDRMIHYFEKYKNHFERADKILVEQQPIMGFVSIQELFRFKFQDKVKTIHPRSMHCYFGIQKLNYEERKKKTIEIAWERLSQFKNFMFEVRKNDMADALCLLEFYLSKEMKKYKKLEWRRKNHKVITNLNVFRYNGDSKLFV